MTINCPHVPVSDMTLPFTTRYPVPADASFTPPEPCVFQVGDVVTVINGYGVEIPGIRITGFVSEIDPSFRPESTVYLDWDCYWFSVNPDSLRLEQRDPAITQWLSDSL